MNKRRTIILGGTIRVSEDPDLIAAVRRAKEIERAKQVRVEEKQNV